jgi:threonine dehydrogenase-like Zn-dependent dehydrogenase
MGDARVVLLDADPVRVAFAVERLGLEAVSVSESDPQSVIAAQTSGRMADVAIEAVGSIPAFKSCLRLVRDEGRVVVVGVYGAERYDLPMGRVWVRGLDLRFAGMANVQANWDDAIEAIQEDRVDPTPLVTHHLSLDEAEKGYELFAARQAVKVVLVP